MSSAIKFLLLIAIFENICVDGVVKDTCSGEITVESAETEKGLCYGSVIIAPNVKQQFVVTTAECVQNLKAKQIFLTANWFSASSWHMSSGSVSRAATRIIIHPNYNHNTKENNIAIVHIQNDFPEINGKPFMPETLPERDIDDGALYAIKGGAQFQVPPRGSSDPCYAVSSDKVFIAHERSGKWDSWAKSGNCLSSANGLAGILSTETTCPSKGPDFHVGHFTNIYKYNNWLVENSSHLPQPKVFLIMAALLTYFIRSLF